MNNRTRVRYNIWYINIYTHNIYYESDFCINNGLYQFKKEAKFRYLVVVHFFETCITLEVSGNHFYLYSCFSLMIAQSI